MARPRRRDHARASGSSRVLVSRFGLAGDSPSGDRVAVTRRWHDKWDVGRVAILDGREIRLRKWLPVGGRGRVEALAWTRSNDVFVVGDGFVSLIDAARQRLVWTRRLQGRRLHHVATSGGVVMLRAPTDRFGSAWLVFVGRRGTVRIKAVPVSAGWRDYGGSRLTVARVPGLAVDPSSSRAFVVSRGRTVVVDLRTFRMRSAFLRPRLTQAERPVEGSGFYRYAHWLGGGRLAVSGWNIQLGERATSTTSVGFQLINLREASVRTVDRNVDSLQFDGRSILASQRDTWVAYSPTGTRRFSFERSRVLTWVGRYGYLVDTLIPDPGNRTIVDLETGAVLNRVHAPRWPIAEASGVARDPS